MIHSCAIKSWLRSSAAHGIVAALFLLGAHSSALNACDTGCGTGNSSMGMLSQVETDFVGVRYRTLSSESHLLYAEHLRTKEFFKTTELWARYSPADRLQLTGVLPYQFNSQLEDGNEREQRGIGDIILMAHYALYTSAPSDEEAPESDWQQRLLVGGGVKLPTGRYEKPGESGTANANFQLGTGSTDILLAGSYMVQSGALSANAEVNYRINTENSDNYRFGNRLNSALTISWSVPANDDLVVAPELSLYAEWSAMDARHSMVVEQTGGNLLAAVAGADIYIASSVAVGARLYIPVSQELADGQIKTHNRFSVQCAWLW